jgi:hypothetical protein
VDTAAAHGSVQNVCTDVEVGQSEHKHYGGWCEKQGVRIRFDDDDGDDGVHILSTKQAIVHKLLSMGYKIVGLVLTYYFRI